MASLANSLWTLAPRIGPPGATSPSACRSERRSGRSQTKLLSLPRQERSPCEGRSLVSGSARAILFTSSQLGIDIHPRAGVRLERPAVERRRIKMFARVARWEGADAAALESSAAGIRAEAEKAGGPPEGLPAKELLLLHDAEGGKALAI